MSEVPDCPWTVETLAKRVGMSVRNIRAHQSRGLIPPPQRRGRVAYYGAAHEQSLLRIQELQQKGYNLAAVEEMVSDERNRDQLLQRIVLAPLMADDEVVVTRADLAAIFNVPPSSERLRLGLDTGLLRDLGNGRYAFPSRQLLDAISGLVQQGLPLDDVHVLQVDVANNTRHAAERFVETALRHTWDSDDPRPLDRQDATWAAFEELLRRFTVIIAATFAVNVRQATETILSEVRPTGRTS